MPVMPRHAVKGSRKRHTWPRTVVEQLETIPESPRTTTTAFDSASRPGPPTGISTSSNSNSTATQYVCSGASAEELRRAQMLWFSHHLAESQQDREMLRRKITEMENACRAQSKINAGLRKDVESWQNSYDMIEVELIEAAQEIEEAKAYVRSIETSNANLRYALSQVKEQVELDKQKRWHYRLQRWFIELPGHISDLFQSRKAGSNDHNKANSFREGSETPVLRYRGDTDRSGAFSRLSKRTSDPQLPSSSPLRSPASEKD